MMKNKLVLQLCTWLKVVVYCMKSVAVLCATCGNLPSAFFFLNVTKTVNVSKKVETP